MYFHNGRSRALSIILLKQAPDPKSRRTRKGLDTPQVSSGVSSLFQRDTPP